MLAEARCLVLRPSKKLVAKRTINLKISYNFNVRDNGWFYAVNPCVESGPIVLYESTVLLE